MLIITRRTPKISRPRKTPSRHNQGCSKSWLGKDPDGSHIPQNLVLVIKAISKSEGVSFFGVFELKGVPSDKPELLGFLGRPLSFMIKDSEALTTEKSLRCQADKFRVLGWKACALLCSRSSTGGSANILILFAESHIFVRL